MRDRALPHPLTGIVPLVVVLVISFLFHEELAQLALILALGDGMLFCWLLTTNIFTVYRLP